MSSTIITPYKKAIAITASDATVIPTCDALYIGGAGAVAVRFYQDQANATFAAVPVGTVLPVRVDQVLATGTVATNILALYI
jgi:hypothetical protein